jgi:hypothetical protein
MALCVVIAGAFAVFTGLRIQPDAKSTVSSMGSFGVEVAQVKDSIDKSLKSLEDRRRFPTGRHQDQRRRLRQGRSPASKGRRKWSASARTR